MAAKTKPDDAPELEQAPELVRLIHPEQWSGDLGVGEAVYPVVDGVVEVTPEHVAAAHIAGFRAGLEVAA
jgi:hypothetical protein